MKAFVAILSLSACLSGQTLKKVAAIDLPGPKGQRFDYLTMDEDDHYLLSGHLGPGILYVIDVRTNALVKAIPGVPGITGVEYVPGVRKIYTSNWGENKIGVIDLRSMSVVKRLPTAAKPNGSVYAAPFKKLYVSDTDGLAVAVVDVEKDVITKALHFNSETGMPQYDSGARKIWANLRRVNEIAEIDPTNDTVVGRYPVGGCEHNHGMAIDSTNHRAFLLCGGNRTFTVFALDTHKAIAHFPLPAGADVVKFDPGTGRIYAACSSGAISVFQEKDADHFQKLEDFPVQKLVHSLAVDSATHRVYAPEQEEDGKPVARMIVYEPAQLAPPKRDFQAALLARVGHSRLDFRDLLGADEWPGDSNASGRGHSTGRAPRRTSLEDRDCSHADSAIATPTRGHAIHGRSARAPCRRQDLLRFRLPRSGAPESGRSTACSATTR